MDSINKKNLSAVDTQHKMKHLLVFALITLIGTGITFNVKAQTFSEWFSQNKTQKKYLLQQLAALQVYSGYLKKGYGIATNGLGSITEYLKSENGEHNVFYNKLKTANPIVKDNPMVKDIVSWQQDIIKRTSGIKNVSEISEDEKRYLSSVCSALLQDCDQQLKILENLVTDDKIEMSDAERLTSLAKVHEGMLASYRFVSDFESRVKILALNRQQDKRQVIVSKQIYGIN